MKHKTIPMKPVVVKMPAWLHDAVKVKAGERGVSAYLRELVMRDVAAGRRRKKAA